MRNRQSIRSSVELGHEIDRATAMVIAVHSLEARAFLRRTLLQVRSILAPLVAPSIRLLQQTVDGIREVDAHLALSLVAVAVAVPVTAKVAVVTTIANSNVTVDDDIVRRMERPSAIRIAQHPVPRCFVQRPSGNMPSQLTLDDGMGRMLTDHHHGIDGRSEGCHAVRARLGRFRLRVQVRVRIDSPAMDGPHHDLVGLRIVSEYLGDGGVGEEQVAAFRLGWVVPVPVVVAVVVGVVVGVATIGNIFDATTAVISIVIIILEPQRPLRPPNSKLLDGGVVQDATHSFGGNCRGRVSAERDGASRGVVDALAIAFPLGSCLDFGCRHRVRLLFGVDTLRCNAI
mmetsp:Transcript_19815/g.55959  ORF Transcript_19815/g.55959 Transcript_19815/m.55959 type:complete len:343 (+) Transcript_19815:276-1304(+)